MNVGPLHLTNDVSIAAIVQLVILITMAIKFLRHLTLVNDRVERLWNSLMGVGPEDPKNFFYRFAVLEQRVAEMWAKLGFERRELPRRE